MKVLISLLLSCACLACSVTQEYVGKTVRYDFPAEEISEDSGHHKITVGVMTLDYYYRIDRQANKIICDGFVEYNFQNIPGGQTVHGMKVTAIFLDSTRMVIAEDTHFVSGHRTTKRNPFKQAYSFDPRTRYLTFTYSGYVD
jgi:hypothetical protein